MGHLSYNSFLGNLNQSCLKHYGFTFYPALSVSQAGKATPILRIAVREQKKTSENVYNYETWVSLET